MRIKIASRKSDLARIQSLTVGSILKKKHPNLDIEFEFRSSFGDLNLDVPLESSSDKGLFTADFHQGLVQGNYDLVVHSWKDLPVEANSVTEVVATLPRADQRDLLLFKKSSFKKQAVKILSSSPRRVYNLTDFLSQVIPGHPHIEFLPIRGNIPTRIGKFMKGAEDGFILAKAALDRMLEAEPHEFGPIQNEIREALILCNWMVLPLSVNPAAAAQGALGIEIKKNRNDLHELLKPINCSDTFESVVKERNILKRFGGGCHQKIGISILKKEFGEVTFLKGITDDGLTLNEESLKRIDEQVWKCDPNSRYPLPEETQLSWFQREKINCSEPDEDLDLLYIARVEAYPEQWLKAKQAKIWCSGIKTWKKLAEKGIWVNGCSDSLGENIAEEKLESIMGKDFNWQKLTHNFGEQNPEVKIIETYKLIENQYSPNIHNRTHFFWMSGSSFLLALKKFPEVIKSGNHGCGVGLTHKILLKHLPAHQVRVFLNYKDWFKSLD